MSNSTRARKFVTKILRVPFVKDLRAHLFEIKQAIWILVGMTGTARDQSKAAVAPTTCHSLPLARPKSYHREQKTVKTICLLLCARGSRFKPRPNQLPQHLPTAPQNEWLSERALLWGRFCLFAWKCAYHSGFGAFFAKICALFFNGQFLCGAPILFLWECASLIIQANCGILFSGYALSGFFFSLDLDYVVTYPYPRCPEKGLLKLKTVQEWGLFFFLQKMCLPTESFHN